MEREQILEEFRSFVKRNSYLNDLVKEKKATWQELYEMWYINGEDDDIWNKFKIKNNRDFQFADLKDMLKNINIQNVQRNISQVQRIIDIVQSILGDETKPKDTYEERPFYKKFED